MEQTQKRTVGRPRKYPKKDETEPKKTKKGYRKFPDDVCSSAMMAHILKHYQNEGMTRDEASFEYFQHMKHTAEIKIQELQENLKKWNDKFQSYETKINEISVVLEKNKWL